MSARRRGSRTRPPAPGRSATLARAAAQVAAAPRAYLAATLLVQGVSVLLAFPLIARLFDAALAQAGVGALTHLNVLRVLSTPTSVLLLVLLALVASVVALVQQGVYLAISARLRDGAAVSVRAVAGDLARAVRRLVGPQLLLFVAYVFVLVPLGGFGVAATVVRGIALPNFVVTELLKFDGGLAVYVVFLLVVLALNLRLVLTTTVLLTSDASVAAAMSASWRMTRGVALRLLGRFATVLVGAFVISAGLVTAGLVPTRLADVHLPAAAPAVAGASLAVVQVLGVLLAGLVAALCSQVVVLAAGASGLPDGVAPVRAEPSPEAVPGRAPWSRRVRTAVGLLGVAVFVGLAAVNTSVVAGLAAGGTGAVVAHRGYPGGGVENTVPALEAAAALGPEYVELDVLQTADGELVVFHDTTLRRLAGSSQTVAGSTLDELTATTVRQGAFEAQIPSLEEFVLRAKELDQPLLVELKRHGSETPGFAADVVALLREHDVAGEHLVQSIYPDLVDEVRALGPEISVGYVVPFSRGGLGDVAVDFVVVEEWSVTPRLRAEARAAGVDVLVWTVNDPAAMRAYLQDGLDGIITGDLRSAVGVRDAVAADTMVSTRLEGALRDALWW
ncbi:glycerophosphodiester phosphodiesterase [Oerskovia flava]|uniref:glycerophosphodiester phosphodiesterase n=1 Tax=Oerskovia flava TaxID=2986422 RepID=UPI002240969E|nr:glycerophosphodiester phosphodiesterase [Oerskovia sp. JB1-3-2]